MRTTADIQNSPTYRHLIERKPFLQQILLRKKTIAKIELIVWQFEHLGIDFVNKQNYNSREINIAKEIIANFIKK